MKIVSFPLFSYNIYLVFVNCCTNNIKIMFQGYGSQCWPKWQLRRPSIFMQRSFQAQFKAALRNYKRWDFRSVRISIIEKEWFKLLWTYKTVKWTEKSKKQPLFINLIVLKPDETSMAHISFIKRVFHARMQQTSLKLICWSILL